MMNFGKGEICIEPSITDTWFCWYPVRLGALSTGRLVWLKRVWRNRCAGVTIYQEIIKEGKHDFSLGD